MLQRMAETKKKEAGDAVPADLPGQGTEHGAVLQQAHDAFTRGDYRSVLELTGKLEGAPDEVVIAGEALRRRVGVDPMQVAVLGACLLFFLFIVWKYVL